jgi:hypothetical protein
MARLVPWWVMPSMQKYSYLHGTPGRAEWRAGPVVRRCCHDRRARWPGRVARSPVVRGSCSAVHCHLPSDCLSKRAASARTPVLRVTSATASSAPAVWCWMSTLRTRGARCSVAVWSEPRWVCRSGRSTADSWCAGRRPPRISTTARNTRSASADAAGSGAGSAVTGGVVANGPVVGCPVAGAGTGDGTTSTSRRSIGRCGSWGYGSAMLAVNEPLLVSRAARGARDRSTAGPETPWVRSRAVVAGDRGHRIGGGATSRCREVCAMGTGVVLTFAEIGADLWITTPVASRRSSRSEAVVSRR